MKLKLYVLDKNRQAVPATEKEWAASLMSPDRFVGQRVFHDDIFVSTVFLGLDHNWSGHGPPLLYETMVFGGPLDQQPGAQLDVGGGRAGPRAGVRHGHQEGAAVVPKTSWGRLLPQLPQGFPRPS